jgi:hypothetical protein
MMLLAGAYFNNHQAHLFTLMAWTSSAAVITVAGIGFLLASWIVGTLLDATRELLEWPLDWISEIDWALLFKGDSYAVQRLQEVWLPYYYLAANYSVGLLLTLGLGIFLSTFQMRFSLIVSILTALLVFAASALLQRKEIRALIPKKRELPHQGVYSRLIATT